MHDVAVGIRVPLLGHLLTRRGVKRRRSQSAHGLRSAATGGSATSAAILFSSAKHETYTSTGLWIRSCARSAEMTRGCPRLHAHRAEGPLLREQPSGGGPHHVRVRLPRPRRLAQCPAGRAQHALRARRRRRVPPSRDVRAEVEEDEAVRRRETPLHQLHQRSKRACRASLERGIIASVC